MTATDPQTAPVQPTPPPRKSHRRRAIAALFLAACTITGGTIAGLAITAGSHPAAAPQWHSTFTPSASAPAQSAPAVTAMAAWCAGPGWAALQAVSTDISQVGTDAHNQDLAATEADGARLTAGAEAALKLPPPVTSAQQVSYAEAMGAASFAGIYLGQGNLTAATRALAATSTYLGQDKGILSCP